MCDSHLHVHINHFAHSPPSGLRDGFEPVKYTIVLDGNESPVWITTAKRKTFEQGTDLFERTLLSLSSDTRVIGYMELEEVLGTNLKRFFGKQELSNTRLPMSRPQFVDAARAADLHIFRNAERAYDDLDCELLSLGFYLVYNEKQRIWTLLMESRQDAQLLSRQLQEYFGKAGGIDKIEMEFVTRLEPVTPQWKFLPVAVSGFY